VTPRVLTVGETMALLDPVADGALELGGRLTLRIAGAESNFAIALARLGVPVTWVSRVGADPLGGIVRETLASEGVDVSYVRIDEGAPTGVFSSGARTALRTRSTIAAGPPPLRSYRGTCRTWRWTASSSST
jgi:2-dehydro-3-deoxygluconokinase